MPRGARVVIPGCPHHGEHWGEKERARLDAFIRRFLVIPYDSQLAKVWARVVTASKKEGRQFEAGHA